MRSGERRTITTRGAGVGAVAAIALAAVAGLAAAGHAVRADPAGPKPFVVSVLGGGDALTIADALARAPADAPIRVRAGTYRESLTLSRVVELRAEGADPKDVVIEGTTGPAVRVTGGRALITGFTLRVKSAGGAGAEAAVVVEGGEASFATCVVATDSGQGVAVRGEQTKALLADCRVSTPPREGIVVRAASVVVEQTSIEDARSHGIALSQGASLRAKEVTVSGSVGDGIAVSEGSTLTVVGGQIRGSHYRGIGAKGAGTSVSLDGLTISSGVGDGVVLSEGAVLEAKGCEWSGLEHSGLVARGEGVKASLHACRVHHNKFSGMLFDEHAEGLVEDCDVGSSEKVGIEVRGDATAVIRRSKLHEHVTGADLLAHDACTVRVDGCEFWGGAVPEIWGYEGARIEVRATKVHDTKDDGVSVETNARVLLADVTVVKCKGTAFVADGGGHIEAERCTAKESNLGARISKQSEAVFTACELLGSLEENLVVETSARVTFTGGRLKDARKDAVYVQSKAEATLVSVDVSGNRGYGIVCDGATLTARDCKVKKNGRSGAAVQGASTATFEKCVLTDNADGAWRLDAAATVTRKGNTPPK